jgi:WD40 repeat protein
MDTEFSPCGHYFALATVRAPGNPYFLNRGCVQLLDRRNGLQTSLQGHAHTNFCPSFSDDGKYLVSVGTDRSIQIWPTNSTRKPIEQGLKSLPSNHSTWKVQCLAFASGSNLLASGSRDERKL